jgi:hypothetical protein
MIRTDKLYQWGDTQMAEPAPHKGLDYQGRYADPEAAHAAIDWDDDERPIPGSGPVVWLVWGVVVGFGALLALHFFGRMGWL